MTAISFEPTEADLIAGYRLQYLSTLKRRRTLVKLIIAAAIFALISIIILGEEVSVPLAALMGALYFVALLGLVVLISYAFLPRRVRRIFRQQKSLHREIRVEWSSDGISFETERGHATYQWTDFVRLVEGRKIILLMQSDALFNFIPKRAISLEQAANIMDNGSIPTN